MDFSKLDYKDSIFQINSKKPFGKIHFENTSIIKDIFNFANDMTFRFVGEHRSHRTGGTHRRKKGEIFSDTFQGKLSEYATYQVLKKNSLNADKPNLERYKLGKWDSGDMTINGKKIAIKSAKHFSNLLMLEVQDWDDKGNYLPDEGKKKIDLFILVRIKPDIATIMKKFRLDDEVLLNEDNEKILISEIEKNKWEFDIPGYATNEDIISTIKSKNIILKGNFLNSYKTKMDADNYYIQSGDLRNISTIKNFLT